ncbi:MAG: hypothetical protein HZB25_06985 [Candidatus Eisenbacteria bacterium]|nr:hypothetical protein [Candidatus Eisenbacteria bacterium]
MAPPLQIAVLVSGAWALGALATEVLRSRARGRPRYFSRPAGDPRRGVLYAFGPGMSPTAKESTRENLPAWVAGVAYHLGIFASLALLAVHVAGAGPAGWPLRVFRAVAAVGALAGAALLAKRLADSRLRRLSVPDDLLANILCTGLSALTSARAPGAPVEPLWLAWGTALLLYIPLGKIRHCFFFFTTRAFMGAHFGRRGTFPPPA